MSGMRMRLPEVSGNRMGAIRYDVDGYGRSAQTIVNFLVHTFGGLSAAARRGEDVCGGWRGRLRAGAADGDGCE